ncbi:MAG: flagellar hook protein FlgE [Burkholderiales bacterium]
MAFQQGLSGLNAAAKNLEVIGNNVANASTVGFKASHAIFADIYSHSFAGSGSVEAGIGVSTIAIQGEFGQGNVSTTNNPLDMAINGMGFFVLSNNGAISYSRNGQFHLDENGYLVNAGNVMVTGYGVDDSGAIVASSPGPIQVSTEAVPPAATTAATIGLNLDARQKIAASPFDPTDTKTYNHSSSMTVYDSLGNPHTLTQYYSKTAANTWDVNAIFDGDTTAPFNVGSMTFDENGKLPTPFTPFNVSVTLANGATTPFAFTVDMGETTQFGTTFAVNKQTQDGATAGALAGYGVNDDGMLIGRYSNGQTRTLGQLVLAKFANNEGLQPLGGNAYAETTASGQPLVGTPGSGSFGMLQSGAVEESNVDLTEQLVNMITAQRVYQANAQTIKTEDQIMQTLVNLR